MDKLFVTLYVWQLTVADKLRARREAGQGTLEYVGMIAVAAVIIIAVVGVLNKAALGTWVEGFINAVKGAVKVPGT
jgi:hypothetical protein